jgi:predicted dehydrogenase
MSKPLRTAILGCGNFGARHAANLITLDEIELVAFCSNTTAKAEEFNQRYAQGQGTVYADSDQMFEQAELDLVFICLPPFAHSNQVLKAAEQGVHIFIEKPIALQSEQAWRMVHAVEEAGIKSQVGFMWRFGAAVEHLKEALESGEAGAPTMMLGRYFSNSLHSWWWRDRSKSGGQVVEQAIHLFDLMRYLLGEPASVFARFANLLHNDVPDYSAEDVSSTIVTFANGAIGTLAATNTAIPQQWTSSYWVVAQKMTADFQSANQATFALTSQPGETSLTVASKKDMYMAETLDLIRAIREDRPTRTPMREGADSLDLVLAAARSAEAGQMVEVGAGK